MRGALQSCRRQPFAHLTAPEKLPHRLLERLLRTGFHGEARIACDAALQTFGGFGYAKEFYVERLWREVRLYKIAPVSQQMALNYLAEHVLGLPRSY